MHIYIYIYILHLTVWLTVNLSFRVLLLRFLGTDGEVERQIVAQHGRRRDL